MTESAARARIERALKYLAVLLGTAILYVLFDYLIDFRPASVQSSYRFGLRAIELDKPVFLRQDNLVIVVVKRSAATVSGLVNSRDRLQDPESRRSTQPEFARNPLRSRHPEYFVAYAIGTDFGCPLELDGKTLKELCGPAQYDFAGRAITGEKEFRNLPIPNYNFSDDFTKLTIKP